MNSIIRCKGTRSRYQSGALFLALILSGFFLFTSDHSRQTLTPPPLLDGNRHDASRVIQFSPLIFEQNQGQVNEQVKYMARTPGCDLFLLENAAVINLKSRRNQATPVKMSLVNANTNALIRGQNKLKGKTNYLLGNDKNKWRQGIANFEKVKYDDIYPGIDLVFYGKQGALEYDFIVSPGIDPDLIEIEVDNADNIKIDDDGNLRIETGGEVVEFKAPVIYQQDDHSYTSINGHFCLNDDNVVTFNVGSYDSSLPLVIDPQLVYSTYLGTSASDQASDIAVDTEGNAFVVGQTLGSTFPTTDGSYKSPYLDNDVFVTKISHDGSQLLYSAIIGGRDESDAYGKWGDYGYGIAVDTEGNAIITGQTKTKNFPTVNAFQGVRKDVDCYRGECGDAFVTKLNATGSDLIFSTYLGGKAEDSGDAIAVDDDNNVYITGKASWAFGGNQFPTTPGVIKEAGSGNFIAKFAPHGELKYSTFLTEGNNSSSIAADKLGNVYVAGRGSRDDMCSQHFTLRVIKVNNTASGIVYTADACCNVVPEGIAVDAEGNCYVGGAVGTSADLLPVTGGAYQAASAGDMDAFVAKWNASGTALLYCTYLGGSGYDYGKDIDIDKNGNIYIIGFTRSTDFPTVAAVQEKSGGGYNDTFVAKINPNLSGKASLVYSTYLGGGSTDYGEAIAVDGKENAYVTGYTHSSDFPTRNAIDPVWTNQDGFVARIGTTSTLLIFDQVMRGDLPIAPPLAPPATQQIVQQYRMMSTRDTLFFSFEGRSSDGMVGLRLSNTRANFPLKLSAKVLDPDNKEVGLLTLFNIHADNFGARFSVDKDGLYTIAVFLRDGSGGPFPAPFEIHLSGYVGLPRKLINGQPEVERGTRLDILFNHPAPRPQILAGADSAVAQTGLFKFANPVSISAYAIAVMLPPTPTGYPIGEAIIRAADPVVLGQLQDGKIDRTTPTARTPEWTAPRIGSIFDFTQVPLPHSVEEWPPLPPLHGTILSVIWENDGLGVMLPLSAVNGAAQSIILDMGFSQEIVDGEGNDLKVFALAGSYAVAVGNTPYSTDFITLSNLASGDQEFDLNPSGLTSARFVRIMANPAVTIDAVKSLNVFADAIRVDIGPVADMAEATILMRRMKGPETALDPFLELIAPDGSRLGENESGFGDETSLDLSDAALIGIDLTQVGFHRFLGRGYHQVPNEQSFGSYFVRLESGGIYDTEKINVSGRNEAETIAQKSGRIYSTQQRDSYLFKAQPGQKINIVVNAVDSVLNPLVELYDPEEFLIASNDNFANRGKNAVISVQLPDSSFVGREALPNPSTYRIAISAIHASGSSTWDEEDKINVYIKQPVAGGYELKVFTGALTGPAALPPSVTNVTPQRIKVGISNTAVTILGENFQNDAQVLISGSGINVNHVQFLSSTRLVCRIDISPNASLGWRDITIVNPDGQKNTGYALLKIVDLVGNVQLTWTPPNSSAFLAPPTNLTVRPGGGLVSSALPAQAGNTRISATPPIIEVEPNNRLEQAMVLSGELVLLNGNAEVSDVGAITQGGDDIEDLFKVTTSDPGVSLALDSFTADCDLYLLAQNGALIFSSTNRGASGSEDIAIQGLPNGTYYIGVSIYDPNPAGGSSTPYMLTAMGKFEGGGETPAVQKYNIYRSTNAGAKTTGIVVGNVEAPVTQYFDSAPFSARYYYQVSAVYDSGESAGSNEVSLIVTSVESESRHQVSDFALFQSYPNPFNPSTSIEFALPQASFVTLKIYDVLGNEVATLVAEKLPAGKHQRVWEAKGLVSGVYLYRLEVGAPSTGLGRGFVQTKKLILLR